MNEPRQRAARPLVAGLVVMGALVLSSGCDAGASVGGAQTAVVVAQTAVGVAQTALPALQTSLPGIQSTALALQTSLPGIEATAQAGATQVAAVLSDPQAINAQLQLLLAGAAIDLKPTPSAAANADVTQLAITGTDTRNTLAQMDASTRQATASAALQLMAQYYPKATISLTLVDTRGGPLLSGTKAPGGSPAFQ